MSQKVVCFILHNSEVNAIRTSQSETGYLTIYCGRVISITCCHSKDDIACGFILCYKECVVCCIQHGTVEVVVINQCQYELCSTRSCKINSIVSSYYCNVISVLKYVNGTSPFVTRFVKRGLPHTFNLPTLMIQLGKGH